MTFRVMEAHCVACRQALHEGESLGRKLKRCSGCGGVWIDRASFASLASEAIGDKVELIEHNDGSPRRDCPECAAKMDIVWLEFLALEQCAAHGIWLDRDEMERVLKKDVVPADLPNPDPKTKAKESASIARFVWSFYRR